jgi:hypothetical protein
MTHREIAIVSREQEKDRNSHTLFTTTLLGVDPEPSANTTSFRTGWHPRRDREICGLIPNARLVHTEDGKVLRLDFGDVRFVGDRECTTLQVP